MTKNNKPYIDEEELELEFGIGLRGYRDLMPNRIREILLVSSHYEAFTMEEDGPLLESIDIRLTDSSNMALTTPNITRTSTAAETMEFLKKRKFDMVITMPKLIDMNAFALGQQIKKRVPKLPVFLLTQNAGEIINLQEQVRKNRGIDKVFVWSGNPDLFLAMIKHQEDHENTVHDIAKAMVRVIIFVEDSPVYKSSLLPILYKEIFRQTATVFDEGLNEKQKLLKLRARPKILIAKNYEGALKLYRRFKENVMAVFSDTRFPRKNIIDPHAGIRLLEKIRQENPFMPLLLLSTEHANAEHAAKIPASFLGKHSPSLHQELKTFFSDHLGFGDFVFRMPDGKEIARAANLRTLEKTLPQIPDESIVWHIDNNHFSGWLMSRSEVFLALRFRKYSAKDFSNISEIKEFLLLNIKRLRELRQRGTLVNFSTGEFDSSTPFIKMGKGSMGGKARGLAFMSKVLAKDRHHSRLFSDIQISIPQTIVITAEWWDLFIQQNNLENFSRSECNNEEVIQRFLQAELPHPLINRLRIVLAEIKEPIAVRSSSLLEDSHFEPYAGLYSTYMLPNCHFQLSERLKQLTKAIKLVYASVFFEAPRTFTKGTIHRTEEEKMAVVLQKIVGRRYGTFFYPAISGVAQSHNFYPLGSMLAEEGIAHIALGLGKTVVEGGRILRFSPNRPNVNPGLSSVDEILKNSQRFFYALRLVDNVGDFRSESATLIKREISDAIKEAPVAHLCSSYMPEEHCIRDTTMAGGAKKLLTFANILKYDSFPLGGVINHYLQLGKQEFGCDVEIEFSLNLPDAINPKAEFFLLQIRPMTVQNEYQEVNITEPEEEDAFCISNSALGNGVYRFSDIVYINPKTFSPAKTVQIAAEIKKINASFQALNRKYLLIGPGRWGSSDNWLGIPVNWENISNSGAIIECTLQNFHPDPSQGSHMFHNLISLGVCYLTVGHSRYDKIDYDWLENQELIMETTYVRHIRCPEPFAIKVDGRKNKAVILPVLAEEQIQNDS